ncbi:MAG: DNA polymerase III subunit beta [Methylomonas sp.]|nr:DNA polymerase III subunit beta [Methylomonas sp.]PPD25374.1 MAG: DNA polymerase III subunit beta [Methylomonas sp.]PPD35391.1 MAG: DNA polymerase III subunit beta [Methylomonas sp.]PPD37836.1 MAG: DNA polymerase III subunit beta [Methylomonas sp.]PPD53209.1 MAG: DNA polymerase III subunit beta [Methylomonas sp.]
MKLIISKNQLLPALQQIVSVIEKRHTLPILANVLMEARQDQLVMTGTDTEIQLITQLRLDTIEQTGDITVPARKFLDIVRLLPGDADIRFEVIDDKVKLTSGRARFSLSTLPAEHYPDFNESEYESQFLINAGKFKKGLDKTVFCMASQDVRYYLNGLLLHISNARLKMVASDGHRLSIFEDDIGQPTGFESRIIIPRKAVQELGRLLDDADAELSIQFSANTLRVYYKDAVFSSKLIDAKFPDFGKVFNQAFMSPLRVQKQLLRDALTRVAILSNEKYKGVSFDIRNDAIKLSAHNPEHDEAEEEILVDSSGEALSISFNAQYMLDALSNVDGERATLTIASNASSCFIEDEESSQYRFIVMPMRI